MVTRYTPIKFYEESSSLKELFVIIVICRILLLMLDYEFKRYLKYLFGITSANNPFFVLCVEFATKILPTILLYTLFSEYLYFFTAIACTVYVFLFLIRFFCFIPTPLLYASKTDEEIKNETVLNRGQNKLSFHFISEVKASIMLQTCIAILAVDFGSFPDRHAKSEFYGLSLMDFGIGGFVFSSGLSSHHARGIKIVSMKFLKKVCVMLLIGFIRLIAMSSIDYHVPVKEYGVHWNFYFTLFSIFVVDYFVTLFITIPICFVSSKFSNLFGSKKKSKVLKLSKFPILLYAFLGILFLVIHQFLLTKLNFRSWMFSATRNYGNFVSANKEGIGSITGFLSIYYFGASMGRLFSSFVYDGDSVDNNIRNLRLINAILIIFMIFGWFSCFFLYEQEYLGMGILKLSPFSFFWPSRRLVNTGYVLGILLLFISIFALAIFPNNYYHYYKKIKENNSKEGKKIEMIPKMDNLIVELIKKNGLLFFLTSNISTGIVNMLIEDTKALNGWDSVVILMIYMFVQVIVGYICCKKNIRIL